MTLPHSVPHITSEEYLRRERDAPVKHEYYHGEVFAMAGGTPEHALIISNVTGELRNRLKGKPCRVYSSDLRVRIPRTTLYTYPDITVIYGVLQFDPLDAEKQTVVNPTVIVEVLSPSTESWDRGGKFQSYRQVDSLREYVLVSSNRPTVEAFVRQPDNTWNLSPADGRETVAAIKSLGIELPLSEVYDGVEFPLVSTDRSAV